MMIQCILLIIKILLLMDWFLASYHYENGGEPTIDDLYDAVKEIRGLGRGTVDRYGEDILRLMKAVYRPGPRPDWKRPPVYHQGWVQDHEESKFDQDDDEDESDDHPLDEVLENLTMKIIKTWLMNLVQQNVI